LLAGCLASGAMAAPAPPMKEVQPLPDDHIKAWKEAGAISGWMGVTEYGSLQISSKREELLTDQALPGLQLRRWLGEGMLARLPAPDVPFGLYIDHTSVTDEGMREVASLKNLTMLSMCSTKVTDAGLGHLVGLKRLTALDMRGVKLTDVGVGRLAGLPN